MARNKNIQRQTIKLERVSDWIPYKGKVLIKIKDKEGATTRGGILIGFLPEVQYGEGTDSHVADLTATEGDVVALPLIHHTAGYDIPSEIKVGDHVWFSYVGSLHGIDVPTDIGLCRLIDYSALVASRSGGETKILNGFVLLEDCPSPDEPTAILMEKKRDLTRGVVRYLGEKRTYDEARYTDEIELSVGDTVLLRKGLVDVKLERTPYLASFDGGKMYRRVKRRDIVAVLSSFEIEK